MVIRSKAASSNGRSRMSARRWRNGNTPLYGCDRMSTVVSSSNFEARPISQNISLPISSTLRHSEFADLPGDIGQPVNVAALQRRDRIGVELVQSAANGVRELLVTARRQRQCPQIRGNGIITVAGAGQRIAQHAIGRSRIGAQLHGFFVVRQRVRIALHRLEGLGEIEMRDRVAGVDRHAQFELRHRARQITRTEQLDRL